MEKNMFTVEFDHDNIEITVVDDGGFHEDLKIDAFDDIVYIRQWDDETEKFKTIAVGPQMWEELIAAIASPAGAYTKR